VDACRVIASVSRALSAVDDWTDVLDVAASPDLELVISNTTEVGITLDRSDRPDLNPPRSFPGKLTAVLARRAQALDHDPSAGLVILPCELIDDNGDRLREVVLELARHWELPAPTIEWIASANTFCNSLVDCIVTGFPDAQTYADHVDRLGYEDPMLTVAEPYRLWAIEGGETLARRIDFLSAQEGVVVTPDIREFRERKVRLLNGAHTLLVPVSLLCGHETVLDAMVDEVTGTYVRTVMLQEIVPSLATDQDSARSFARDVLERYANPFIRHELTSIALQQTSKLRNRLLPTLERYSERFGQIPPLMSFGIAAMVVLKRQWLLENDERVPEDDADARWRTLLTAQEDVEALAHAVSNDATLWESAPGKLPGFAPALAAHLKRIERAGPREALQELLGSK
jgi:tagaturonate reductase